jgi:hypothetical protein
MVKILRKNKALGSKSIKTKSNINLDSYSFREEDEREEENKEDVEDIKALKQALAGLGFGPSQKKKPVQEEEDDYVPKGHFVPSDTPMNTQMDGVSVN